MNATEPASAVYVPGDAPGRFIPTELSRGPWHPDAQHGGAPAALAARCVEQHAGGDHRLARLTLELLKPVPLTPLEVAVDGRAGRSAGRWEVDISSDGVVVAHARAVTVLTSHPSPALPGAAREDPPPVAPPTPDLPRFRIPGMPEYRSFYTTAMDPRVADGTTDEPGAATAWFRFAHPLVAGERTRPSSLAAAAADFANGLSWVLPLDEFVFSNADVSVHLWRSPIGDCVGLAARTSVAPNGTGVASGQLFDTTGTLGIATQTLVVRAR